MHNPLMSQENLTKAEFDTHIANGTCRIAFVGMSNAGKSYRARVLHREKGFAWHNVDAEIQKALGFAHVDDLAPWLGYPSSPTYAAREQEYLHLEDRFTRAASEYIGDKNMVFDTTGSVVHLPQATLDTVRTNCLVVHLDVGEDSIHQLIEKYFTTPKPVCWGEYFTQRNGENENDALRRCYPALLKARLEKYRALAHVQIPARELFDVNADATLAAIRVRL